MRSKEVMYHYCTGQVQGVDKYYCISYDEA